jgi:hypothetical protein
METIVSSSVSLPERIREMEERFGLIVAGRDLVRLLGYRTPTAFRQAARRESLGIQTFFIRGRRGRCARTSDVARWAIAHGALVLQGGTDETTLDRSE